MFRIPLIRSLQCLGIGLLVAAGAFGETYLRDTIQSVIDRFIDARKEALVDGRIEPSEWESLQVPALEGVEIGALSAEDMARLNRARILDWPSRHDAVAARIKSLEKLPGADGAGACILALDVIGNPTRQEPPEPPVQAELIRSAIKHPGLNDAMKIDLGARLFSAVSAQHADACKQMGSEILSLDRFLVETTTPSAALGVESLMDVVRLVSTDEEKIQDIRARSVAFARHALAVDDARGIFSSNERDYLNKQIKVLDGRAAKGQLVNHPAPELRFLWSYPDEFKSLSDFKGKVVVLDFWATWCGPCVASFPDVKQLQARYAGFPVEIIGVTSVQGFHIDPSEGRIPCDNDPDKEFALMREYTKSKDITWNVAFSDEPVFNADYGVGSIPHVVIIDPAGVVRHSQLHPSGRLSEKAAKIDAILREFRLQTPPPVEEVPSR